MDAHFGVSRAVAEYNPHQQTIPKRTRSVQVATAMKKVVGVFERYAQAESAVEDLDVVGVGGEDVLLIPGAASDAIGRGYIERAKGDLRKHESLGEKILDVIHSHEKKPAVESSWVRVDGQAPMPKNDALDIEDAELTDRDPSLEGPAVLIVRVENDVNAEVATQILQKNDAAQIFHDEESASGAPETSPARAVATPETTLGTSTATTGADDTDLGGRGQKFKSQGS